jgi:hypothetical protein
MAEIPGNENISFPGGKVGATAIGEVSARKTGGAPGTGGVGAVPGAPGTSAVAPANDAAIARRSDSVNGPGCMGEPEPGTLGDHPATGDSRSGSISSVNIVVGISSASASGEGTSAPFPFAKSCGIARKNSFASLSSVAGSGKGIAPKG